MCLAGNELTEAHQIGEAEQRPPRGYLHKRVNRRQTGPRQGDRSPALLFIKEARAPFTPILSYLEKLKLATAPRMKGVGYDEDLYRAGATGCD
jgi:hypothetical protein